MSAVLGVGLPGRWSTARLKHVTALLNRGSAPTYVDQGPVRAVSQAANQAAGLHWTRTRFHEFSGDPRKLKGYLRPDDVLINSTGTGTLGRVGYFTESPDGLPCMADSHVTVVRGKPDELDSRFAYYWLGCRPFQEYVYAALVVGATNQIELNRDRLGDAPIPLPPLEEQRRIADFLDAETARIDELAEATEGQRILVSERRGAAFQESVREEGGPSLDSLDPGCRDDDWSMEPLNRVLRQLTNGYVGPTRDLFVANGVPYLQSLHIKNGRVDFSRRPYYVQSQWAAERPRIRLGFEDLLIVQTGAIGEVGIVDQDFVGASCHALLIARTHRNLLLPRYMWHAFRSHWGRHALLREQTGALHPHLEAGNVRFMKIPVPSVASQLRVMERTEEITRDAERVGAALERRTKLQAERRQALITAAVTGQFDVSTASGRNVTDGVQ
ncbi:restriction endonuclease subunit S [Streptomyces noursei]|uniref:restriction endonuclease subunit S n=1 Tax=Streptomyces noursei TaxID=1971 RepID=UPI0019652838|nr:restriction endonuclease subunit S [Streptomyces noursei]QRX92333.1 restriction endonuclease subunit S [Streptomyces noursei]